MKTEIFYDYIDNQNILSDFSLNNIEELLNEYPYFQTARTLHLINLYNISDIKFENFLKYNAVFIPDRKLLFQKIHFENTNTASNTFSNKEDEANSPKIDILELINEAKGNRESSEINSDTVTEISAIEDNPENIISVEIATIEETIVEEKLTQETSNEQEESLAEKIIRQINEAKENGKSSDSIFDSVKEISAIEENPENIIPVEITTIEETIVEEKLIEETNIEQEESLADRIIRQINEAKENGESSDSIFNAVKEISETGDTPEKKIVIIENEKQEKENLIDKFIKEEPRIIADRNYVSKKKKVEESSNNIFSEKLAEIYVKQKLYDKAIEIYHKLNLKNSEKSVYFAEKIKKVEELKNNN